MGLTRTLAEYLVGSRIADIPPAVQHEGTRALLNWIGCAAGGCRHDSVDRAWRVIETTAGSGDVSLIGRGAGTDALTATLINAISGHVLDFDDAQPRNTNINPSSAIAPAAIALGEHLGASGQEVLHAFLLGIEVECRIANTVWAQGSTRFFANSTAGVFGAAAAAGKLLRLDEQQMTWALGMAATQSAGLRVVFGTMCKGLVVGRAAQNGVMAALLARERFTSSDQAIEAPKGFGAIYGPGMDLSPIVDRLGVDFEMSHVTYKPYACGIVLHAPIDACIRLRKQHGISPDDIVQVDLEVNPAVIEVTGNMAPTTGLEGKFSISHCAAVALLDGAAGETQFSDARVQSPDILALRARVRTTRREDLPRHQAMAHVQMTDGRRLTVHVEHAIGSRGNPLTDADIADKVRSLADGVLSHDQTARVIEAVWNIGSLQHIGDALRPARGMAA